MHVMIDLETMGVTTNAVIISIGAVGFDKDGIQSEFYRPVSIESCMEIGLQCDASTIMWWMGQSDEARGAFTDGINIRHALMDLRDWMAGFKIDGVWGNGVDFDNMILGNAYEKANQEKPWSYGKNRCYRTVKNLFKNVKMERSGTHHNALDDAKSQAEHLIRIMKVNAVSY